MLTPIDHDELVGTMLGKDYRVIQPIGIGGMAVVYLVEHQTLLKQFAAKVLSPALASSMEARARFTQEAHAASQLDHENIVSITDFGVTADHRPFFVMELLRGQTLDERLTDRPMPLDEVVAVAVPVARALAHAHAEGIVHLDVKPENIFLVQRSQGRWGVKVVDFGIAKTPLHPQLASPEETAGSPMYMAPEVIRGADDVDQRADIYSFGILLYLMMCGRLPFVDDSLTRILQMQLVQLPVPPRELNAELSPELAAIIERCLAKRPEDRYPSMDALLREFEAALPPGADRQLIAAQLGSAPDAPFAAAMAVAPIVRPSAPRRASRWPMITGAIAVVAIGAVAAQRLTSGSQIAPLDAAPAAIAVATPSRVQALTAPPSTAPEPAPKEPELGRPTPIAKRPATHPKATVSRGERRPSELPAPRRVAMVTPTSTPPVEVPPVVTPEPPPPAPLIAAPAPIPVPAPPAAAPAPAPGPGSLDAVPDIASLDVKGAMSRAVVERSLRRALPQMRDCYRTAARAGRATPAIQLTLSFEIDENSSTTGVHTGAGFSTLASCVGDVVKQIRTTQASDTGTTPVTAVIRFQPS